MKFILTFTTLDDYRVNHLKTGEFADKFRTVTQYYHYGGSISSADASNSEDIMVSKCIYIIFFAYIILRFELLRVTRIQHV